MSKRDRTDRQAAAEDAELRARLAAFEDRQEAAEAQHRQQMAQLRLEQEARELQTYAGQRITAASAGGDIAPVFMRVLRAGQYTSYAAIDATIDAAREGTAEMSAARQPAGQAPATPPDDRLPRDDQGRWLPQQPAAEQEPAEIDYSALTLDQYVALRSQLGVSEAPPAGPSRRPGHTKATNEGIFDGLPGYRDPRSNTWVFESQLTENRGKSVPPGYMRRSAEHGDEWK
jgi:hypothetical protein